MTCPDCTRGIAPNGAPCLSCDGTGRARDTLPAPPPSAEDWPDDEAPTGVECPDAMRKQP